MNNATPLAPDARAAYGIFAAFPRHQFAADLLVLRLIPMQAHAAARISNGSSWKDAALLLNGATVAVTEAFDTPLISGRPIRRAALAIVLEAITAFEKAHAVSLPYDDHGRYTPAPGEEYPFSVSDIGRAAVQLLGPDWQAESAPWGVAASIEHEDEPGTNFHLGVGEQGDLYVSAHLGDKSRRYLVACAADGLSALAALVAETVHSVRDAD
ncbi:hypothetical protein ACO0M4_10220 [Streptomyces sp. RGM 3693]|uniref:hypothetical protein n=1 Tax=Streptomyces sp. RGM 3693 TaxID=3413284 RepID=UPI003D2D839A